MPELPEQQPVPPRPPDNPVRLYAALTATLERLIGSGRMGDLLGAVRASQPTAVLPLAGDPAIRTFMLRMGLARADERNEVAGKRAEELVRLLAEANHRSTAQTSLALRLFTSGLPGYLDDPVCGRSPLCRECGLTKDCDFHNAPPKPLQDRTPPGRRLLRDGPKALSDEALLAVLSAGLAADKADVEWAEELMKRYGTLRALFAAPAAELAGLRNATPAKAARLAAAAALYERWLSDRKGSGPTIRNSRDLFDLYHPVLRDRQQEVFLVVLLDNRHRVQGEEFVAQGTLTQVYTHPREVFRPAVRSGAAALAVLHNHPSGDPSPSMEDNLLVERLRAASVVMQIPLVDAIIMGESSHYSYVDNGKLSPSAAREAVVRGADRRQAARLGAPRVPGKAGFPGIGANGILQCDGKWLGKRGEYGSVGLETG